MVDGGSTHYVPPGTFPVRTVPLGGIPTPFEPPVFPPSAAADEVLTGRCEHVSELDAVFGTRGAAAHCWCQFDRMPVSEFRTLDDAHRRAMLETELQRWPAPGVIATIGGERVGWCSVAPRSQFSRLRTGATTSSPATAPDDPSVWSVTCFVVRPGYRRRGVATALLAGAIDRARSDGGGWLEAYPVDSTGRKETAADLYRGTLSLFRASGFEIVARPRPGRAIVRLEL